MPISHRHIARIVALQTLFELEFAANSPESILERTTETKALTGEAAAFAAALVKGVLVNRQLLDDTIHRFAPAFPVDQLFAMDRTILRLALHEILITKTAPPKVVVNEAVELAKEFGADTSPKFINGVLGSVITDIHRSAQ
ncbi:MAG: transcription antitermination factor NusB [Chloroflexi bacterium]|nr:transcription antitermination factor NusB [Chloroflexota bacterium]